MMLLLGNFNCSDSRYDYYYYYDYLYWCFYDWYYYYHYYYSTVCLPLPLIGNPIRANHWYTDSKQVVVTKRRNST